MCLPHLQVCVWGGGDILKVVSFLALVTTTLPHFCFEANKRETVGQSLLQQTQMADIWPGRKIIQEQQKESR